MSIQTHNNTARQILFWWGIWAVIPLLFSGWEMYARNWPRVALIAAGAALVVAFNLRVLLPRLYFQKKYAWFMASALLTVLVVGRVSSLLLLFSARKGIIEFPTGVPAMMFWAGNFIVPMLITLIGSTLYEISLFAGRKEQEAIRLRAEKLEAEIKFLKSQTNPHFLFNALNNIYTLTLIKSDAAPENLLKLSAMLRYMLYDCNAPRVPLRKEIEYLRHFVDLFRLKDSGGIDVRLDLDESRPEMPVAPLIFIPFVENAFKHSDVEKIGKGWVAIRLATTESGLTFEVKNSLPDTPKSKDAVGGIGLENVVRQLELCYPGRHRLDIRRLETIYEVFLTIEI